MNRIKSLYPLFLLIVMLSGRSAFADQNKDLMQKGNTLYTEGMFEQSKDAYELVISNGFESSELYFNLGNSYFKLGEIPSAILFYEKALRLSPKDEDILYNLEVANGLITDKIEQIPVLFYNKWKLEIYNWFSPNGWAVFASLIFILVLLFACIYILSKRIEIRKFAFFTGIVLLSLDIASFAFAYQKYRDFTHLREAIVFEPTLNVNSSPDSNSKEIFVIHEGIKVRVLDTLDDWYRIELSNGSEGWIKSQYVKEI
ncbi:MAG: tetratricopeptide repeat protein [Bacteroidales bacterium]|nr:tetratricopeptide repeat protein [Bacteroidales bacterium]